MRALLLMRGAPGCGKSTWIREHGLSEYTLSADDIRMLCSSPQQNIDGSTFINPKNDTVVWETLFNLLKIRMKNGEFTVIDATHSTTESMKQYRELASYYRYRIYCIDMTGVPKEETVRRNMLRASYKRVPLRAIERAYARFETQNVPAGITVIQPDELDKVWFKKISLSAYKKIHIFGDIHGCNTVLQNYFKQENGFHPDEFYLFTGDYIDRGLENAEVIRFLMEHQNDRNIMMLEGNHERWLRNWANDETCPSKEFEEKTRKQIEQAGIRKKDIRELYRHFGQCAYFDYCGKTFLVSHGGISNLPDNLTLFASEQMIKGVGDYAESEKVEQAFEKNVPGVIQIHAHRNVAMMPVKTGERSYNLEGSVEFGGHLRIVQLLPDGEIVTVEMENPVFRERKQRIPEKIETVHDMIAAMRNNPFITEKPFGNISSFNFTRDAFYDKVWNEQTVKARGLYINTEKEKIAARSYDKFFHINERPETKIEALGRSLKFPVSAYVKENGYLGLAAYNEETNDLLITSKSSMEGDFALWLKEQIETLIPADSREKMKEISRKSNVTFVFECIDPERDPHVIEYRNKQLVLLDIVYNDIQFRKFAYKDLVRISEILHVPVKKLGYVLQDWSQFLEWYQSVIQEGYKYQGEYIEGFVLEDSNGKMMKVKTYYYEFWKYMRSISMQTIRCGYVAPNIIRSFYTPLANYYYAWIKSLAGSVPEEEIPTDICSLRRMFFADHPEYISLEI